MHPNWMKLKDLSETYKWMESDIRTRDYHLGAAFELLVENQHAISDPHFTLDQQYECVNSCYEKILSHCGQLDIFKKYYNRNEDYNRNEYRGLEDED